MRYSQAPGPGDSPPRSCSTALVPPLAGPGPWRLGVRRASFYQPKVLHVAGFLAVGSRPMEEITPGIRHWSAVHPNLGVEVSSYWLPDLNVLLDPIAVPEEVDRRRRDSALQPPPQALRLRGARAFRRRPARTANGPAGATPQRTRSSPTSTASRSPGER